MSAAFDGSGYRRRVLAPLRARTPVDTTDPFLVADLDPVREHTDSEVAAQLARVMAFLQRERNSAKYAALATELVRRRGEWEAPLLDGDARARLRHHVLDARRSGDAERLAKVDGYLVTLRDRFGGIPASRVAGLRRLAAAAGVTGAEFDARLGREVIIADALGAGVEALAPEVRSQIRQRLADLRVLRGGDRVGTVSLWAFLGLPLDAPPERVRAAWESVAAGNARRPHDREKTLTADLLAIVRARLIEGEPAAYTAGLMADVADELRPVVEEHVVLDGELTAVAYEGLVRAALAAGRGLGAEQARTVILGIARELGAAVSTGGVVDYVLCPGCGRPEPVGGSQTCRYCDAELYTTCPSCASLTEAAAVTCRRCGHSLRQLRAAGDALAAVRHALEGGRPRDAREGLARARAAIAAAGPPAGGATATADDLESRVRAALGAAEAGWRALAEERSSLRSAAAVERARWLVAQAADVPGPDGRSPAEVLGELTAEQAVIRRRVEAARALPPEAQEAALVAVLATAVDNADALRALAALPLQPPADLTASVADDAVMLRWRPSSSVGPVTYRVERILLDPASGQVERCGLGTTSATGLTDAGARAWIPVRHEVTAVSGDRRSVPVATGPIMPVRDVADLRAERTPGGVRLTWRTGAPADTVTVERTVDPGSAVATPPRRARVTGGVFLDPDVVTGVGYHYHAFVEYTDVDGRAARTPGARMEYEARTSPRPVTDLVAELADGQTALRWSAQAGADVRVYATAIPAAGSGGSAGFAGSVATAGHVGSSSSAGPAGPVGQLGAGGPGGAAGPADPVTSIGGGEPGTAGGERGSGPLPVPGLGTEGTDVELAALVPPLRLVGASRSGHLRDAAGASQSGATGLIYTPVTVYGERGVVGRSVRVLARAGGDRLAAVPTGQVIDGHAAGPPASTGLPPLPALSPADTSAPDAMPLPAGTPLEAFTAPVGPRQPNGVHPPNGTGPLNGATGALPTAGAPPTGALPIGGAPPPGDVPWSGGAFPAGGGPAAGAPVPGPATSAPATSAPATSAPGTPAAAAPMPAAATPAAWEPGVAVPVPAAGEGLAPGAGSAGAGQIAAQAPAGMPPGPAQTGPAPAAMAPAAMAPAAMAPPAMAPAGSAPAGPAPVDMVPSVPVPPSGYPGGPGFPAGVGDGASLPGPHLPPVPPSLTSVSYTVSKAGWRRRTLRVQVRATGPVPRLVLIARPGEEPPASPAEGHVLSELPSAPRSGTWTMEVTLEGAQLPWGVRLLPMVAPGTPAVWVDHPADAVLVVR